MLGYLQGTSCPDIGMATHQCARFCSNPKLSHERAVKRIVRYILDSTLCPETREACFDLIYTIQGLGMLCDANFAGGWKDGDHDSPESVMSRTGYVIMFVGCPIT